VVFKGGKTKNTTYGGYICIFCRQDKSLKEILKEWLRNLTKEHALVCTFATNGTLCVM
jgi:hypothetical protein